MPYQPSSWNNQDPSTPLSAPRLANLETQYTDAMADVVSGATDSASDVYTAFSKSFATVDQFNGVINSAFYNYGVRPVVPFTGSSWNARSMSVPPGYSGPVTFDSADWGGVAAPTDALEGDRWIRQAT